MVSCVMDGWGFSSSVRNAAIGFVSAGFVVRDCPAYWKRDPIHLDKTGHRRYGAAITRKVSELLSKRSDESVHMERVQSSTHRWPSHMSK